MKKNTKIGAAVLAGAVIGAAAAIFAGTKAGKKTLKAANARLAQAMQLAAKELQKVKNRKLTAKDYEKLVATITKKYAALKRLSAKEQKELSRELTKYWRHMARFTM